MTILEAVRDPQLFAPWFQGRTWQRWYVALAAIFALPLEALAPFGIDAAEAETVYATHTGRASWPTTAARELWGLMGRRAGKSLVMSLVAVFLACFRTYRLTPGERGTVMLIAADRRQARVLRRYIGAFLREIPLLRAMVVRETRDVVDLDNGVSIEIHVASYRSTRGYTCVAVICDEICFWPTDEYAADSDTDVLEALRPSMVTVPGALLMAISSPYAKRGEAWRVYRRYWGQSGADVLVWRAATREMNPAVDPGVVARAYAEDDVSARSEYGAEWRDDVQAFLDREAVDALVPIGVTERPRQPRVTYRAHCDPSGGRNDSMTLAIGHLERGTVVVDLLAERRPPFQPATVVQDFAELLGAYGLRSVTVDSYAAEWTISGFRQVHVHATGAERTTSQHYRELLPRVTGGTLSLVDDARLVAQLAALERRVTRGGHEVIGHPPGGHDDLAAAVAGLVAGLTATPKGGALFYDMPGL